MQSKVCPVCNATFFRESRKHGNRQWAARVHCSRACGSHKPMRSRLEARVHIDAAGCWMWTGPTDHDGYGRITVTQNGKRSYLRAHRASFEQYVGPLKSGEVVLHTCDKPGCINPLHLRAGTHADNALDKMAKGRSSHLGVLDECDVRAIRASAATAKELAAHYGVTRQSIRYARSGKTWSHVQ